MSKNVDAPNKSGHDEGESEPLFARTIRHRHSTARHFHPQPSCPRLAAALIVIARCLSLIVIPRAGGESMRPGSKYVDAPNKSG
ncbi:MAG: hypothetical protein AB7P12_16070, partial [Alphaproteobacteria bacterium]